MSEEFHWRAGSNLTRRNREIDGHEPSIDGHVYDSLSVGQPSRDKPASCRQLNSVSVGRKRLHKDLPARVVAPIEQPSSVRRQRRGPFDERCGKNFERLAGAVHPHRPDISSKSWAHSSIEEQQLSIGGKGGGTFVVRRLEQQFVRRCAGRRAAV